MIRCNRFCSGGRAIPARRTLDTGAADSPGGQEALLRCIREYAGEVDLEALRQTSVAPRLAPRLGPPEMTARTWTFLERTKIGLKRRQNP